jgi:multidrug resistance efflux pump
MKKLIIRLLIVAVVAAAGWYGYRFIQQMPQRQQQVATTRVRQSDVIIRAFARGELRAVRSVTIIAPNLFGTVQVTRLAPLGSLAKDKDLIVEFDDSERRAALEETLLEVEQIDEQVKQKRAELAVRNNQDQVDLLKTRYSVRRAELEVQRNPLLSEIDQKKNLLNLEETRRRLKQLESDIKSRQEQALAELNVLSETRNKSMIDVAREKQRISQTRMLSPMTGLVAVKQNRSSVMFFGQQLPDIREGDTLRPGMPVADVLDLSELEVVAKIGELDRANLHEGQDVVMELDAISGKKFHGKIKGMSGTASANVWSGDPAKKFDVIFSIDMRQLLRELGATPQQIQRIMETAEKNAKKAPAAPPQSASPAMAGGPGGPPGGAAPTGGGEGQMVAFGGSAPAGQAGRGEAAGGTERGGRAMRSGMGGGGAGPQMSEEDRKKFREALQKELGGKNVRDLSPEERQKAFE